MVVGGDLNMFVALPAQASPPLTHMSTLVPHHIVITLTLIILAARKILLSIKSILAENSSTYSFFLFTHIPVNIIILYGY